MSPTHSAPFRFQNKDQPWCAIALCGSLFTHSCLITCPDFFLSLGQGDLVLGLAGRVVAWLHCQWSLALCGSAMHLGWDLAAGWWRVVAMCADRTRDGVEGLSARRRWHGGGALGRAPAMWRAPQPWIWVGGDVMWFDGAGAWRDGIRILVAELEIRPRVNIWGARAWAGVKCSHWLGNGLWFGFSATEKRQVHDRTVVKNDGYDHALIFQSAEGREGIVCFLIQVSNSMWLIVGRFVLRCIKVILVLFWRK